MDTSQSLASSSISAACGDERALVDALRAGDPEAARNLVDRYQGLLFGVCLRMLRHRQDAEDVLQDTLLRALRGIRGFDSRRPLRPWLLGIAANRCRTAIGRRLKRPHSSDEFTAHADPRPGLTDPDGLGGELQNAIERLRPDYRMVFILFHENGLPYEEISEAVGRPIGTVKTWLHRARAELAEYLARRGHST
jgi:RNA polymerase sigma-70 factor (ECF subfamily)